MHRCSYRGRRAAAIENRYLRVTVLEEGGHVAEICDTARGVNPLWTPPWPSIEPSCYSPASDSLYGTGSEAKLLAGIMGHNICLDIFGGPSAEEEAAGLVAHGEAPVGQYAIAGSTTELRMRAELPMAQLRFERRIALMDRKVRFEETVENVTGTDRAIGWTQHVTLGPPFLEKGSTEFRVSATRSKVFEGAFGTADYLEGAAVFDWPDAPRAGGGTADLRTFTSAAESSAYTAHLMDLSREHAFFSAFSKSVGLAFGYIWERAAFPWLGVWEENLSRKGTPWSGRTLTRGMEFGVSPFPESRRQMIERGRLFDTATFRWIPARSRVSATYWAVLDEADAIPEEIAWPR
jgi:hypothetical protein